jgi:uncharacterized membrane protein
MSKFCAVSFKKNSSKEDIKMKANKNKMSTTTLAYGAILTALVIVLQLLGSFIKFGMFSISLVLIPIVIGAALCGKYMGAWLGLTFGVAVLLSGDAAAFLAVDIPGTIITVLVKGTLCGLLAGLVYEWIARKNRTVGVITAAIVCPVVNSGIFLLGCRVFFYDTLINWASASGYGGDVIGYMFLGLIGVNFLLELGINIVLGPVIVRLIEIAKKMKTIR